jgi:MCP family monocarboxylic acid transporter-like MFS transporter 13/MCP family monocarboxylic acid transporter-like MFS transporter 12
MKTKDDVAPLIMWSLFKSKVFCHYLFGVCMGNSGYLNTLFFLPAYAGDLKISKANTAMMLSAVGIADLLSRILGGWFADLGLIRRHLQLAFSLVITGMTIICCISFPSIPSLVVMLVIFGLLGGIYTALMPVVLVDLMGVKTLSPGFGIALMFRGVANVFIPPFMGWLKAYTGSGKLIFIVCGVMIILGGVSFLFQPMLARREARKKLQKDENDALEDP